MAGSRLGFERNEIQLHQVLATKTDDDGASGYPLRRTFVSAPTSLGRVSTRAQQYDRARCCAASSCRRTWSG